MELWDIYDENKERTGRTMKHNDWNMKPGEFHLTVLGVLMRPDGKYLITRRRMDKEWAAGWWEVPGGGVRAGEDSKDAVIREIKEAGDFCIGAACYPEGHPESSNKSVDMDYLKQKVDAGCDFVTTQMFFDNSLLYSYLYRIREKGITIPVIAGIMPVTSGSQLKRIAQMSGSYMPARFLSLVDKYGDNPAAMKQAGIAYATDQIIDLLANDIKGIHVYTMNKPDVAAQIQSNISELLK